MLHLGIFVIHPVVFMWPFVLKFIYIIAIFIVLELFTDKFIRLLQLLNFISAYLLLNQRFIRCFIRVIVDKKRGFFAVDLYEKIS